MSCIFRIFRGVPGNQYWEEFSVRLEPGLNVISGLMQIRAHPVTREGTPTTPVAWEDGCLEEVCGSCSMLIQGRPRQACTAIVESCWNQGMITLAPFSKFPLIRDLCVDRSAMFEALKKIRAWIPVDGTEDYHESPLKIAPEVQEVLYLLSTCMTCGCCSEGCPQVHEQSEFMGPSAISQARLFHAHPNGAFSRTERLRTLLGKEGIAGCGNAQNCAKVCPKKIPLTESIAVMGRHATRQALHDLFGLPDS